MTGISPPPTRVARPVKTVTRELTAGHFVTKAGQVPATDFLKAVRARWKDNITKEEESKPEVSGKYKSFQQIN